MQIVTGHCLCKTIQYEFKLEQLIAYQCHCTVCQRATGTAFSTTILASEADFKWYTDTTAISSYSRESGYILQFCALCSSPVPNKFRSFPFYSIPAGGLTQQFEINIAAHLFLNSRAPWDTETYNGKLYQDMPSIDEMFLLLH